MDVSVIIPVHNGERHLAEAIESVLEQVPAVAEVLVVDDGSTDGSAAIAGRYARVQCCHQPHSGIAAARNRGLELARGEVVGFLDADDRWCARRLAELPPALASSEPVMVFGGVEHFVSPETPPELRPKLVVPDQVPQGYLVGALLTQKDTFARVGPFDPQWRAGEFIDWYLRAKRAGIAEHVQPRTVLQRRLHANNYGRVHRNLYGDIARVVAAHRRAVRPGGSK